MSAPEREDLPGVDRLARETRDATKSPHVDWASVDAKLFARIEAEAGERRRRGSRIAWLPVGGVLAAAAAVALLVGRAHDAPVLESPSALVEPGAGTIALRDGDGDVLVDGRAVATGASIGAHAVIETRGGARALVERAATSGTVAFWVEPASRVTVTQTRGKLVVALDRGAIEAKVKSTETGEPFAVDVGASRVAVQASQVRVARDGNRAVVDLNEGTIAIGASPRTGETHGATVSAPAHAEFSSDDAVATLTVDHAPTAVRPAVAFAIPAAAAAPSAPVALAPPTPSAPPTVAAPPRGPTIAPKATASAIEPHPIAPDPNAETSIARAVRACIAGYPPAAGVKLTVSTVVEVRLADDGAVQLARFAPPLAPDTQACATAAIFRVRFAHGGTVSIPVDYQFGD